MATLVFVEQRDRFRRLRNTFELWPLRILHQVLGSLFPAPPTNLSFHPINDMKTILGYQYRLTRTAGMEVSGGVRQTHHITPFITETGIKLAVEGEYVELGDIRVGDLHFPER